MKIMIIGCGRVGSGLANRLDSEGHQVTVLDRDEHNFRRLSEKFKGERVVGNGLVEDFIRPTLEQKIDCLFVVTDRDNVNLMIAQKAKRGFEVGRVIARVHDPQLASLYNQELGQETVCPTDLVTTALLGMMGKA